MHAPAEYIKLARTDLSWISLVQQMKCLVQNVFYAYKLYWQNSKETMH